MGLISILLPERMKRLGWILVGETSVAGWRRSVENKVKNLNETEVVGVEDLKKERWQKGKNQKMTLILGHPPLTDTSHTHHKPQ